MKNCSRFLSVAATSTAAATAPVKKKIVVFGGNGYIGQYVINRALKLGLDVTSVSRSGCPIDPIDGNSAGWVEHVKWEKGDVLDFSPTVPWKSILNGQDGVVSCIGSFGSNEFMEKLNGHANVNIAKLSSEAGVKNFAYISADGDYVPSVILRGYFDGKRLADQAVSRYFKGSGVILRPGFVYGSRKCGTMNLPLHWIGSPLEWLLCTSGLSSLKALSSGVPISVQDVAIAAVAGATGEINVGEAPPSSPKDVPNRDDAVECRHDEIVAIRKQSVAS